MMIDKRLVNLVPESKKFVFLTVFLRFCSLAANTLFIFCVAGVLKAVRESGGFDKLNHHIVLMLLCLLVTVLANIFASRFSFRASSKVKITLRTKIYEKLLSLGTDYQENSATAKVIQTASEGVEQIETWFSAFLPQFYYSMIAAVVTFCVIAFFSLKMALVLLACIPLIPISMMVVQGIAKKILGKYWAQYANLADNFLENLEGLTTLQIYGADGFKAEQMAREAETFRRVTMKVLSMQLNSIIIMDVVAYGGAAAGICMALSAFRAGSLDFYSAFVCILLSADFFIPLRRLGSAFHTAMNGVTASKNIFALLDSEEKKYGEGEVSPYAPTSLVATPSPKGFHPLKSPKNTESQKNAPRVFGENSLVSDSERPTPPKMSHGFESANAASLNKEFSLDFALAKSNPCDSKNLFSADSLSCWFGERVVLKNCSLAIESGSFVAFVGKSGSGKSTLAKILSGIYGEYAGSVKLCGEEIRTLSRKNLHSLVTYISHRDWIFAGSVRDCLLEGKPSATDEKLWRALDSVCLSDFVRENGGLDFILREGGSNLSGGQKQRLSIARALLRDSPVMIFDEATSNIDVESETAILSLIRSLKGTKTVIMISHRAENCADADKIFAFENGAVIEPVTTTAKGGAQ